MSSISIGSTERDIDPLPQLAWPELQRDLLLSAAPEPVNVDQTSEITIQAYEFTLPDGIDRGITLVDPLN